MVRPTSSFTSSQADITGSTLEKKSESDFFLLPYEFVSHWQVSGFWGEKRFRLIKINIAKGTTDPRVECFTKVAS